MSDDFFLLPTPASNIKIELVTKYFLAWAQIITRIKPGDIAYIDLYCGKGTYADNSKATPVLIIENTLRNDIFRQRLKILLNDKNAKSIKHLQKVIDSIPDIDTLKYKPVLKCMEIGEEIAKSFNSMHVIPSLLFVDPWGYKGLSLKLLKGILKDWGCDCIFFFNYSRVNMAINNPTLNNILYDIFGEEIFNELRENVKGLPPKRREEYVIDRLQEALKTIGGKYSVLLFPPDGSKPCTFSARL